MGKILCATRGGNDSIRTQEAAIKLAHITGDELIFFIVFDMEFMAEADFALRSDVVEGEMDRMCDFLMIMAVERAAQAGLEAAYMIKHGDFREQLKEAVKGIGATLVVLGRPGDHASNFQLTALEELCRELQEETNVAFCVLPESEVVHSS